MEVLTIVLGIAGAAIIAFPVLYFNLVVIPEIHEARRELAIWVLMLCLIGLGVYSWIHINDNLGALLILPGLAGLVYIHWHDDND